MDEGLRARAWRVDTGTRTVLKPRDALDHAASVPPVSHPLGAPSSARPVVATITSAWRS